ncbi:hypothetical protein [Flavobacterium sp. 83]|uniref:hypothetical protein n=1 Tax=Flavobacterium sp. 83 TaxID=1131812 RepID=UPI00055107AC|nr:hypothetical protein [Flavobacterium sp. 83]
MEKLKIGDKVYIAESLKWSKRVNYVLDEVIRLTKTQAILSKGRKIINEPTRDWCKKDCFAEYGERYNKWYLQTNEILVTVKAEIERQTIEQWFCTKKFTDEEKRIIYLQLKKQE